MGQNTLLLHLGHHASDRIYFSVWLLSRILNSLGLKKGRYSRSQESTWAKDAYPFKLKSFISGSQASWKKCPQLFTFQKTPCGQAHLENTLHVISEDSVAHQTHFVKEQLVNIFSFGGHMVSVTTVQLFHHNTSCHGWELNKWHGCVGCVPIKLYLQKQVVGWVWTRVDVCWPLL